MTTPDASTALAALQRTLEDMAEESVPPNYALLPADELQRCLGRKEGLVYALEALADIAGEIEDLEEEKVKKKLYLAGRYARRQELLAYAVALESMGYEVTSCWLRAPHVDYPEGSLEDDLRIWGLHAQGDLVDIRRADTLVLFSEGYRTATPNGARHVETGYALALSKTVCIIGEAETIFACLPQVHRYSSWEAFLEGAAAAAAFISAAGEAT